MEEQFLSKNSRSGLSEYICNADMNDRMLHSNDSIVSTSSVIEPIVRDYNNSQRSIVFYRPVFIFTGLRRKYFKSRISFYSNSCVSFNFMELCIKLSGDVHPLPGPETTTTGNRVSVCIGNRRNKRSGQSGSLDNITRITTSRQWQSDTRTTRLGCTTGNPAQSVTTIPKRVFKNSRAFRGTTNLVNLRPPTGICINLHKHMSLCNLNARYLRNKTATIFDYICVRKVDLVAVTEHWLTAKDSAVRAEQCPESYRILDHPRLDHRVGGTEII